MLQQSSRHNGDSEAQIADHAQVDDASTQPGLIEVGWVVFGALEDLDRRAVEAGRQWLRSYLSELFPQFYWRMPLIEREADAASAVAQPAALLEAGVTERNVRRWDYAILVTGADLVSHYQAESVACVSRSLESVVLSTRRIDPRSTTRDAEIDQRVAAMTRRISALVLHAFGHQLGLTHDDAADNYMYCTHALADIDRLDRFNDAQLQQMADELGEIADQRLEESAVFQKAATWRFYLSGIWLNRREIVSAVWESRPWEFPYRLSRLTTAALSAACVLLITAEAWELAMYQSAGFLGALSALSIFGTATFVLFRQRLLVHRWHAPRSEQAVTTNVSTAVIVLLGMLTTYLLLAIFGMLAGSIFFTPALVSSWTGGAAETASVMTSVKPACFAAALAILIGALGATFEGNHYFRHITFVDEEI